MSKNKKQTIFIYPFGPKISGCNEFLPEMDITDQRAPITTVEDAFQMFKPDEEIMDELEHESLDDFEGDITDYDYDDRGELGEDIVLSQRPDIAKRAPTFRKKTRK